MSKKYIVDEVAMNNLRGFCVKGAKFQSPGNVPTGHFNLDFAIHYGMHPNKVDLGSLKGYDPTVPLGLPLGKLVELYGGEGGGKSSLAYRVVGYAQKLGYPVGWIDTEHSFSENLAHINGCDINEVYYSNLINLQNKDQLFYAEDVIEYILEWCKAGIKVIVLDSVANLVPKARMEAHTSQQFMALLPRLLSENMSKIAQYAEAYETLIIMINQIREKVGLVFGNPETTPGGRALKHQASLRIKISKKSGKDSDIYMPNENGGDDILIGRQANVRLEKNRFAKPFFETLQIPMYYEYYFPDIEDVLFDTGRQIKLITVWKGIFSWNDVKVEGRKQFIKYLKDNNLINNLQKDIESNALENNILLPPELIKQKEGPSAIPEKAKRGRSSKNSQGGEDKSEK